jgi:hypothetical protein
VQHRHDLGLEGLIDIAILAAIGLLADDVFVGAFRAPQLAPEFRRAFSSPSLGSTRLARSPNIFWALV